MRPPLHLSSTSIGGLLIVQGTDHGAASGAGGKGDAQKATVPGETASHSPYPVDSTTRAMSEGKAPSFVSAAISSAQQLNLPASTAGLFLGETAFSLVKAVLFNP